MTDSIVTETMLPGGAHLRRLLGRLRPYPLGAIGGSILLLLVALCFLGPLLHPTNQTFAQPVNSVLPPSGANLLGTDANGFDVLGRLMRGGQTSLEIALLAAVLATVVGSLYGAFAGLVGGAVDNVLMRLVDVLMSVPFLFVILILAARFSPNMLLMAVVIGSFAWLVPARLVRSEVMTLREREFILAARGMGASRRRLVLTHLIPNALGIIIVNLTFQVADAILVVAALGFLGFGLTYPATDWGGQLSAGVSYISSGYWWLIYPVGGCIVLTVIALNLLGEALDSLLGRPGA